MSMRLLFAYLFFITVAVLPAIVLYTNLDYVARVILNH